MLKKATCDVRDFVIGAAEQIITEILGKADPKGRHGSELHRLKDLLKREYVSSELNPKARAKIIDLIDLMLLNGIDGVESIVIAHDRW